jgi:polysaccharide pyruvyl transferase WcaK-like protein
MTIGVGVMNYNGWVAGARSGSDSTIYRNYIEKMGRFVTSLLERGYTVRLLIGETVDTRAVQDICQIIKTSGHVSGISSSQKAPQLIVEPINSLHDVMRQIGDTDIVVATRFHNVVCALKLARPTISIGYEAKNDAVMTDLGLGEFCQSLEDLDLERLDKQLTELLTRNEHYRAVIRQNLEATQLRVKQHEQELLSKIL